LSSHIPSNGGILGHKLINRSTRLAAEMAAMFFGDRSFPLEKMRPRGGETHFDEWVGRENLMRCPGRKLRGRQKAAQGLCPWSTPSFTSKKKPSRRAKFGRCFCGKRCQLFFGGAGEGILGWAGCSEPARTEVLQVFFLKVCNPGLPLAVYGLKGNPFGFPVRSSEVPRH